MDTINKKVGSLNTPNQTHTFLPHALTHTLSPFTQLLWIWAKNVNTLNTPSFPSKCLHWEKTHKDNTTFNFALSSSHLFIHAMPQNTQFLLSHKPLSQFFHPPKKFPQ